MEKKLLEAYHKIFVEKKNEPSWAVHKVTEGHQNELIHCTIPFVGKEYANQKTKFLIYASAENLSGYNGYLDEDVLAVNRHRRRFNDSISEGNFFPKVHIKPFDVGYLTIAALYIYLKYQTVDQITPTDFLECISFANYCKYTIQSKTNIDYADDFEKLNESHEYIEQDLKILCPDVIIMPKTIYKTDGDFIDHLKGDTEIIPIYQLTVTTINAPNMISQYPQAEMHELPSVILDWYGHLNENGITKNFLSVFPYLDEIYANIKKPTLD